MQYAATVAHTVIIDLSNRNFPFIFARGCPALYGRLHSIASEGVSLSWAVDKRLNAEAGANTACVWPLEL